MEKSIHAEAYRAFLERLRAARERAELTQADLATRIGETQSFVSKCERGERRLDVFELWHFCQAMGVPLRDFAVELNEVFEGIKGRKVVGQGRRRD